MKRKKYSPEFKREAIGLVRRSGVSGRQVAQEMGVAPNLLTRWVREAQPGTEKAFPGTGSPRDEELARLKRELARVTRVRDFLRDAAEDSTGHCNTATEIFCWRTISQYFAWSLIQSQCN